ncbi:MAG TPA: 30S ribosomal protein S13 [Candidatus Dojkabacteria bacterium]|nr:30S ribosomal protein S13 [Candidatus Dojkabacteria bacterium]
MARIAGVELPNEKRAEIGLTYIFGIGPATAAKILKFTNVSPDTRIKDLSEAEVQRLANQIKTLVIEGDLRQKIFRDIKRLKDIKSYRGNRHKLGLPVRGQRTRTNAITRKGKNIAVGGLKRKLEKT